eukprot:CAMPEP_0184215782 /NCGR_PEP_ID=MMETSP0976-20121227/15337_1 /TAXON_ID=483370 /ORGANISM="non described non described, Strain CCMP2097" /LENGTH=98 /DNA_ID=CAMNT_0026520557 /DNA_START=229 /DNA_END=526 /DNA_ORIENTATION=+
MKNCRPWREKGGAHGAPKTGRFPLPSRRRPHRRLADRASRGRFGRQGQEKRAEEAEERATGRRQEEPVFAARRDQRDGTDEPGAVFSFVEEEDRHPNE